MAWSICPDEALNSAVIPVEARWLMKFWAPAAVQSDNAISHLFSTGFMRSLDTDFGPAPPRPLTKNFLKSEQNVVRTVFSWTIHGDEPDYQLAAIQALTTLSDLLESDTLSAFQLAMEF